MGEVLQDSERRKGSESLPKWKFTLSKHSFSRPSQDFIHRPLEEKKFKIPYGKPQTATPFTFIGNKQHDSRVNR